MTYDTIDSLQALFCMMCKQHSTYPTGCETYGCYKLLKSAVDAMEKQIPKKPDIISGSGRLTEANHGVPVVGIFCPSCGAILTTAEFSIHRCVCGQLLDCGGEE